MKSKYFWGGRWRDDKWPDGHAGSRAQVSPWQGLSCKVQLFSGGQSISAVSKSMAKAMKDVYDAMAEGALAEQETHTEALDIERARLESLRNVCKRVLQMRDRGAFAKPEEQQLWRDFEAEVMR